MADALAPTGLSAAMGKELREFREHHGLTQEDVAREAHRLGIAWDRSAVASLETGRRELSADELLLWPFLITDIARRATGNWTVEFTLSQALLVPFDAMIQLGNRTVPMALVHAIVSGKQPSEAIAWENLTLDQPSGFDVEATATIPVETLGAVEATFSTPVEARSALLPDRPHDPDDQWIGVAEQKAARRMGLTAHDIAMFAAHLWSRSLTAERERRVQEQAPEGASPRTLQAIRGHVTRALLAELEAVIPNGGGEL